MSLYPPESQRRQVESPSGNGAGLTEQHHREAVAIDNILRKYRKTGVITHTNSHEGSYMDYIGAPDYKEAMDAVAEANSLFESLPAHIRRDMDNSIEKFLDFVQDPDNREQILEYGLSDAHLGPAQDGQVDPVPKYPEYPESYQAAPRAPESPPSETPPETPPEGE